MVFPDANFERAVEGAIKGMNFTWCGQSCGSTSRLFLHDSIHDRFVDALVARVKAAHVPGIATNMATTMGALINRTQYERTLGYVASAQREGAVLASGGRHPADARLQRGLFIEPTIFTGVTQSMAVAREEIFGPVLSVLRWNDTRDMLSAVNSVEFGLTASIWTQDLITAHQTARAVQSGYVWVNDASAHFAGAPFGGYKQSGLGREESKDELFEFTQIKNVNVSMAS